NKQSWDNYTEDVEDITSNLSKRVKQTNKSSITLNIEFEKASSSLFKNFSGSSESFLGLSINFSGLSKNFFDLSENFSGLSKNFFGLYINFFDLFKNFFSLLESFFGLSKNFSNLFENFSDLSKSFLDLSKNFFNLSKNFSDYLIEVSINCEVFAIFISTARHKKNLQHFLKFNNITIVLHEGFVNDTTDKTLIVLTELFTSSIKVSNNIITDNLNKVPVIIDETNVLPNPVNKIFVVLTRPFTSLIKALNDIVINNLNKPIYYQTL
ncbi:12759_t:CDS:1, partial [Dentiscutata heterogama]